MRKINDPQAIQTLTRLHSNASKEMSQILLGLSKGIFRKLQPKDMKNTYIAISQKLFEFNTQILL